MHVNFLFKIKNNQIEYIEFRNISKSLKCKNGLCQKLLMHY